MFRRNRNWGAISGIKIRGDLIEYDPFDKPELKERLAKLGIKLDREKFEEKMDELMRQKVHISPAGIQLLEIMVIEAAIAAEIAKKSKEEKKEKEKKDK